MSDLNIRNIPPELVAQIKAAAAMEQKTLREIVIEILTNYADGRQASRE